MDEPKNREISDTNILIYKRIFCRYLKELGIYNAVISNFFHKKEKNFQKFISKDKGCYRVISEAVDTFWMIVFDSTHNKIKASLLMLYLINDSQVKNIFKESGKNITEKYINNLVEDKSVNELVYLTGLGDELRFLLKDDECSTEKIKYFFEKYDFKQTLL